MEHYLDNDPDLIAASLEPLSNKSAWHDKLINDDCLNVLRQIAADSVNLVITSPPYGRLHQKLLRHRRHRIVEL